MDFTRRDLIKALAAAPLAGSAGSLYAQSAYPSKPVTLLVPQPAGGGADVFCRTLQPQMQSFLGQPVVVDNKGGAAGNIGTALGARAAADGHTITFVNQSTLTINPHLYPDTGFTLDQFIPVSLLASVDLVICANPLVKANNLKELLDMARQAPGRLNYSSAGNGSANHLAGELLKSLAKVSITHIPYRGGGPATTAVLGGEVELSVAFPQAVVPMIKAGKLKALAVTGSKRSDALPDVPTVAESGVKGYEFSSWFGFALPKGTPDAVVARVREASLHALKTPANVEKLQATMTRPIGSGQKEFADLIARESAQWGKLIKQVGIKLD
ncbi:Bug family tripartite tricarboxylate transporter substrate binding protein [Hydrogenophaga pseudoflava]|uniref:Bug family tripartite tricarboxylate transporter substrate binding protein n=1 Tax=Hydrogenophaga pseudoflava TaxID=47421 RepID=UPI000825BB2E|nr:tripartite tricarboxylate transporter substrate binding protein [Hydrogenophaga pseudoflava]